MAIPRGIAGAALAVAALGCGFTVSEAPSPEAPTGPAPSPPPSASRPARADLLPDAAWGPATALGFSVVLPVPDRAHWARDERNRHWWILQHPRSHSTIRVRAWRAGRLVRPEQCEEQARLWLPELPGAAPETRLDERRVSSPDGYATRLLVGVQPGDGEHIEGFVLAFGATVHRCLALLFSTDATGPRATEEVGHRLRMVADDVFGRAEIRSVDDRVQTRQVGP